MDFEERERERERLFLSPHWTRAEGKKSFAMRVEEIKLLDDLSQFSY